MNTNLFMDRLKESIKISGLTQKYIAQKLNIAEGNITHWKNGENLPSISVLYELCILLDVSADYLIGLSDFF